MLGEQDRLGIRVALGRVLVQSDQTLTDLRLRLTGSAGMPLPLHGGPFLTVVSRLPVPIASALSEQAMARAAEGCVIYPADSIHVTLVNLSALVQADAERAVSEWAAAQPPLSLRLARVGCSRASAYAVVSCGTQLLRARISLAATAGIEAGPISRMRWSVGVANFVRFAGPLTSRVADRVRTLSLPTQPFTLREVELVVTDRLLSPHGTTELLRVTLGEG